MCFLPIPQAYVRGIFIMNTPSIESARKAELVLQFQRDVVALMRTDTGRRLLAVICEEHEIEDNAALAYFERIFDYRKKRNKFRTKITKAIACARSADV